MTKQITITMAEEAYNMYLSTFKGNKSQFITWNFIKGCEVEMGEFDNNKQKIIELIKKNTELEGEIIKLNSVVARYKKIYDKKDPELEKTMMLTRSIIASGMVGADEEDE